MLHIKDELQYFYNQLPKTLQVSNNVNLGLFNVDKKQAFKYQWSASRQKNLYTRIIVDFDENKTNEHWYDLIENTGLYPNLVIQNPNSNSCHLHFRLKNPVTNYEKSLSKPFDFYNAVRNSLSLKLGGDTAFTGYIAKNPTYKGNFFDKNNNIKTTDKFKIKSFNNSSWELSELADYLDLSAKIVRKTETGIITETGAVKRNFETFKTVSKKAYAITHLYKDSGNYNGLYNQVLHLIDNHQVNYLNTENGVLGASEQASIARSITNYCMNPANNIFIPGKSKSRNINFGRDTLKTSFLTDTKEKQIISAIETNKQRKNDTELKIKSAIYSIKADGQKVTYRRLQSVSGLSLSTLNKYKDLIKSLPYIIPKF